MSDVQWEQIGPTFNQRSAIVGIWGGTGTGRTTFALSAPGPIAVLSSLERVNIAGVPFAQQGKDIRMVPFGAKYSLNFLPASMFGANRNEAKSKAEVEKVRSVVKQEAIEARTRLVEAWKDAFNWARTVVIDNITDAWALFQLAHFGTQTPGEKSGQFAWGPLNHQWDVFIKYCRRYELTTNTILIGKDSDEYKDIMDPRTQKKTSKKTGRKLPSWQKYIPNLLDVNLHATYSGGIFSAKAIKPFNDYTLKDFEFQDAMYNFPMILGMLTGTDPDEWRT